MLPAVRPMKSGPRRLGLFAAVLALVAQVLFGATLPNVSPSGQLDAIRGIATICQAGAGHGAPAHPPAHHHAPDCALCPCNATLASASAVLASLPDVPRPSVRYVAEMSVLPPSHAPPALAIRPAYPRGPPVLA